MKKVTLKNLNIYCLSAEEKKQVVGGVGLEPKCNIRQVLCDCGSGPIWYNWTYCQDGCQGGFSPECPRVFPV